MLTTTPRAGGGVPKAGSMENLGSLGGVGSLFRRPIGPNLKAHWSEFPKAHWSEAYWSEGPLVRSPNGPNIFINRRVG